MRVFVIVSALLLGLIGLGMSLCGGGVMIMTAASPGGEIGYVLPIAVPSLIFGILFAWLSVRILRKRLDRKRDP